VNVEVDMDTTSTSGVHDYSWLGDLGPSETTWQQVTYNFTTSSTASTVNIYLAVFSVGWVQSDNYSLTANTDTPPVVTPPPIVSPPPVTTSPNGFKRALISLDFDDGWKSAYTAGFPIVNQFGFKASAMIITNTTQNPAEYNNEYMTAADVIALRNQGHKIGSHTATHSDLTLVGSAQLRSEIVNSKLYLEGLLGQSVNYFVTPYCSYNSAISTLVSQYYTIGMRNCDDIINTKDNFYKYNVKSLPVLTSTPLSEIKDAINTAKANNQWLVLMYHEIKNGGDDYSITASTLQSHMQAIKDSGVVVIPSEDAVLEIIK
jgi:peptidoglycan/xylan/chitin deacetylase (PgdA/CDA1 family)